LQRCGRFFISGTVTDLCHEFAPPPLALRPIALRTAQRVPLSGARTAAPFSGLSQPPIPAVHKAACPSARAAHSPVKRSSASGHLSLLTRLDVISRTHRASRDAAVLRGRPRWAASTYTLSIAGSAIGATHRRPAKTSSRTNLGCQVDRTGSWRGTGIHHAESNPR